ncbi:MAG TPA: hypothetical protein VFN42_08665 [Acetobacteraceae bacterium]|nr:hypothetical protein [Acetobacteraceae bacterium]
MAHAASLTITDIMGVSTTISANYYSNAFSVNGTSFPFTATDYTGSVTLPDTSSISLTASSYDAGYGVTSGTLYFVPFAGSDQIVAKLVYSASNNGSIGTMLGTLTDAAAGSLGTVPLGTNASDIGVVGSTLAFDEPYWVQRFSVTAPLPEPASGGMLLAGVLGLGVLAQRRRT